MSARNLNREKIYKNGIINDTFKEKPISNVLKKSITIIILYCTLVILPSYTHEDVRRIYVSMELNISADKVWEIVAVDFDNIQASHPKISKSIYVSAIKEGKVGAQRKIDLSEEGDEYMVEEIMKFNANEKIILIKCIQSVEVPIVPEITKSLFKIEDLGNDKSKISCLMYYQTSPAFLGGMLKGKLKTRILDYFIGIEHYALTGEIVNRTNFEEIKAKSGH